MTPVDFLPGARHDYDESFDWYAGRSSLAAQRFSDGIDATLIRIAANPEQFALIDSLHRACLVKRFPFRIVYRLEPTRALVVAIAHAKRRPQYWRRRGSS
jgi:plasmid stabilization system protein ParE